MYIIYIIYHHRSGGDAVAVTHNTIGAIGGGDEVGLAAVVELLQELVEGCSYIAVSHHEGVYLIGVEGSSVQTFEAVGDSDLIVGEDGGAVALGVGVEESTRGELMNGPATTLDITLYLGGL